MNNPLNEIRAADLRVLHDLVLSRKEEGTYYGNQKQYYERLDILDECIGSAILHIDSGRKKTATKKSLAKKAAVKRAVKKSNSKENNPHNNTMTSKYNFLEDELQVTNHEKALHMAMGLAKSRFEQIIKLEKENYELRQMLDKAFDAGFEFNEEE